MLAEFESAPNSHLHSQVITVRTLKSIYWTYSHSLKKYGIIWWGGGNYSNSGKIFKLQK